MTTLSRNKVFWSFALLTAVAVGTARAHTLFLKLESFFLEPNTTALVQLLNGDFALSENAITRDRMLDVSIVGPGGVTHPPMSAWRDSAVYEDSEELIDTSILSFETGAAGTYVLGVSTKARVFTLSAEDFNEYLAHDGIVDVIAEREAKGQMDDEATERYGKHVKAIVQVGDRRSDTFSHELGYPVELVPLQNPYALGVGDDLRVRFLRWGQPVANHIVYGSHEGYHAHGENDDHLEAVVTRTDAEGIATIPLSDAGRWYVRAIYMAETTTEPDVNYESIWATLTFEIR